MAPLWAALRNEYHAQMAHMAAAMWQNDTLREQLKKTLVTLEGTSPDEYWRLVRAIAEADIEKGQPLDIRIVWDHHENRRNTMPAHYRDLFRSVNPLMLSEKLWRIGLRGGAVLDERIREIPYDRWQRYVTEFVSNSHAIVIRQMADILDEVYMGMPDEYYSFYRQQAVRALAVAEDAKKQSEIKQQNNAAQSEMKQLIDKLQQKVEELISAGMMDEAETVMKEIGKFILK